MGLRREALPPVELLVDEGTPRGLIIYLDGFSSAGYGLGLVEIGVRLLGSLSVGLWSMVGYY